MNYESIQEEAELRVKKDGMFSVEYKNSGMKNWEVWRMYANPQAAQQLAVEISGVIHKKPIKEFKVIYEYD